MLRIGTGFFATSILLHSTRTSAAPPVVSRTLPRVTFSRHIHTSSISRVHLQNAAPENRTQHFNNDVSHAAASSGKKRSVSPEEELLRRVNTFVGQRDASGAVRAVRSALHGVSPPPSVSPSIATSTSAAASSSQLDLPTPASSRPVFSSKAFAAALYACDAAGNAADGLDLVAEVRQFSSLISSDWLTSEHVLFAILRLQCAANDRAGATHMFAYLEQHLLLRLRSASVFLRYCCTTLQDRPLAFAVYEKALVHKIELPEPDYVALGVLCVRVREPISTLFFMLEEMKEHVAEVSADFVHDVLEPWVAEANNRNNNNNNNSFSTDAHGCGAPRYKVSRVEQMEQVSDAAHEESTSATHLNPTTHTLSQCRGVCPACHAELSGYPFTSACRTHLLRELTEIVIPQACRNRRALQGFEHWKRYLHARCESGDRVDVFIDGANLGYYGLSSWYDLAKRQLLVDRGVPEAAITARDLDFNLQCKASGKGVDVGVNFELIDRAVQLAVNVYGLRRPLVMLHERHVEAKFMTTQSTAIVQRWRSNGWLYCSPTGLNDDLCWLYGALLLTDPTDGAAGTQKESQLSSSSHRTFVCTNDKMRDHHFRLLSPRAFTRWRDRHRIGFRCARVDAQTELYWNLPAPYERCIQRHDAAPSVAQAVGADGRDMNSNGTATTTSTWHIPYAPKCSVVPSSAEFSNATETEETASVSHDEEPSHPSPRTSESESDVSADSRASALWICLTATN